MKNIYLKSTGIYKYVGVLTDFYPSRGPMGKATSLEMLVEGSIPDTGHCKFHFLILLRSKAGSD